MKRQGVWIIVLLLGVLLIVWIAYAQQNRRQNMTMPRYETSTEVTAKGVIESVDSQTGRIGWNGTHLVVKFDTATLDSACWTFAVRGATRVFIRARR